MGLPNPAKIALRKQIKTILKSMTPENRHQQSEIITEKVLLSPIFKTAQRISIYLSMDTEVNTIDILTEMFRQHKEVFVPSYTKNDMEMLKINGIEDYKNLKLTKWNIKQPELDEARENAIETGGLDLILLPGVAFTKSGGRLGHGGGYYDKYLIRLLNNDNKKAILIGLAFKEQIVKELPQDQNDMPLDGIISSD